MGHTGWDILYDFLDEILASIMPGAYFISYFVLWCAFFFKNNLLSFISANAVSAFVLFCIVFCYCIGTIFRRSDMKKIDKKSAYYIYKNQDSDSGSYAFADTLTNALQKLIAARRAEDPGFDLSTLGLSLNEVCERITQHPRLPRVLQNALGLRLPLEQRL